MAEKIDDMLFATVNLPDFDRATALREILDTDRQKWFWDTYRATLMLPLMTKDAKGGESGASNARLGSYAWLDYTPVCLKDWFENHVFPWMGKRARVMALLTEPNFANEEHIDCNPHDMGTMQHKFRIVLKGRTDTLYFVTDKGNVPAPCIDGPFIMDGSWPHGMNNFTNEQKLTIAVGAPWTGNLTYNNKVDLLYRSDYNMPNDIRKYFNQNK
jgi:hypothetical protein